MAWILLLLAGLFEVGWAVGLKASEGFTRPVVTAATAGAMLISLGLLGLAVRTLPISTAYPVWTGIGTVGTVLIGWLAMHEPMGAARLGCIALIAAGVAGLQWLGH